jgi:hypothetical protein
MAHIEEFRVIDVLSQSFTVGLKTEQWRMAVMFSE